MMFGNATSSETTVSCEEQPSRTCLRDATFSFEAARTFKVQFDSLPSVCLSELSRITVNSWQDLAHSITQVTYDPMTFKSLDALVGMSDVRRSIEMVYEWEKENKGRMASAYVVYFVETNFSKQNLAAVNDFMLSAAIERMTEWSMIAVLRSSYSAKQHLPAWQGFMDAVRNRLKDNERVEKLLIGLNR